MKRRSIASVIVQYIAVISSFTLGYSLHHHQYNSRMLNRQMNQLAISKTLIPMAARCLSSVGSIEKAMPQKASLRSRILSGVQPTGSLHLGNYLGAIKQWTQHQHTHESFFCVVDLHAITVMHDHVKLRDNTLQAAAFYLAAGIDPSKSTIFVQSHVSAHAELAWLLNCITPMNWLNRMVQFKEKSASIDAKHSNSVDISEESFGNIDADGSGDGIADAKSLGAGGDVCVGLYDYPVLMAADILLYKASLVPVGEDQRQHLELARSIARRFNHRYPLVGSSEGNKKKVKKSIFIEPHPMISESGARLMSLTDGTSKMSKSDPDDASRINIMDPPDLIMKKIKRCKTDTQIGLSWDAAHRPECTNLLNLYQSVTSSSSSTSSDSPSRSRDEILAEVGHMSWGQFKPVLADAVIEFVRPMQENYAQLMKDPSHVASILKQGQVRANDVAQETLSEAKTALGLYL